MHHTQYIQFKFIRRFISLYGIFSIFFALCHPFNASLAQDNRLPLDPSYRPVTSDQPICFDVLNETENMVFAQIISNYYQTEDGNWAQFRHNFRAEPDVAYPVCTTGPFFIDPATKAYKIRLQVKSLIPLLSCYFDLGNGGKTLHLFKHKTPDGNERLWADCDITYPRIKDVQ